MKNKDILHKQSHSESFFLRLVILFCILVSGSNTFASPKTCKALLTGKITPAEVLPVLPPEVAYPDDPAHPRSAKWVGNIKVNNFISPSSTEITCGKPFAHITFGSLKAQGTLPEAIETFPWIKKYPSGETESIPPELLKYLPSTYDYPLPLVNFESPGDHPFNLISPDGTSDICSFKNIDLPDLYIPTTMIPDWDASYAAYTMNGDYKWYSNNFGKAESPKILIEKPQVKIVCEQSWTYDAEFIWPFIIDESTPLYGICPGSADRRMKIHGELSVLEDNKVVGYLDVSKPTVSTTGSIKGDYSGSSFSLFVEGKVYTDSTGKNKLDIRWLKGGQGISWRYSWTCADWGTITNSLPAAVGEYFKVINYNAEIESTENPGHMTFDADGDDKTFTIDMGGQGTVTFKRKLEKTK